MRAFRRMRDQVVCEFEPAEVNLLTGLLSQLIELLLEDCPPLNGVGTKRVPADDDPDDLFARLEREMAAGGGDYFEDEPCLDPVLKRLFPDPYPDDPVASHDFQRFTHTAQLDDKVHAARTMLADLQACSSQGRCAVPTANTMGWLKTLTNVRLALSVRLDIDNAEDAEHIAELPDDDPRSWVYEIYEWLGWVQESLLAAHE